MTSISPEYILETKPKVIVEEINTGSSLMSGTVKSQTNSTNPGPLHAGLVSQIWTQDYKMFFIRN